MTPWQKAKQWQEDNDATCSFEELLWAHLSAVKELKTRVEALEAA